MTRQTNFRVAFYLTACFDFLSVWVVYGFRTISFAVFGMGPTRSLGI